MSLNDDLYDLAQEGLEPDFIKEQALKLAQGKITLAEFNRLLEGAVYTDYRMRQAEMGCLDYYN